MRVGVLYSPYDKFGNTAVEKELAEMGTESAYALRKAGYDIELLDMDKVGFHGMHSQNFDLIFNVCERLNGDGNYEPHIAHGMEMLGINFTGSPGRTLALCNNKALCRKAARQNGIPTPGFQVFSSPDELDKPLKVRLPALVKPVSMHNSIGINSKSLVSTEEELRKQVAWVVEEYGQAAIVEEFIRGTDLEVSLLGNGRSLRVLPLVKVDYPDHDDPQSMFYHYDSKFIKYRKDSGYYEVAEDLTREQEARVVRLAKRCYRLFGLRDYGRIDFRMDGLGRLYLIEVTANPGINNETSTMVASEHIGLDHHETIQEILTIAAHRCNLMRRDRPRLVTADCLMADA